MNLDKFIILILTVMFSFVVSSCDKNDSLLVSPEVESSVEPNEVVEKATTRNMSYFQYITRNWNVRPQDVGRGVAFLTHKTDAGAFAVMANLAEGAKVGMVYDIRSNAGTNNTTFYKKSLSTWNSYGNFFAIANSLFFDGRKTVNYPTLPFPLKQNGVMATYGNRGTVGDQNKVKYTLNIYSDYAEITRIGTSYTNSWLDNNLPSRSYVGFGKNDGNGSNDPSRRRTLVGLYDDDGDGQREYLILLVTTARYESLATNFLENDFLCDQIISFDGGGSSQIMCKGVSRLSSSRPIPVAIVVKEAQYWINKNFFW